MTAATLVSRFTIRDPLGAVRDLQQRDPLLAGTGFAILILLVPLGLASVLDPRLVDGQPVWDKPMRFAFAFGTYLLTLAFFAGWVAPGGWRRPVRWAVRTGVAALIVEQAIITGQAARGVGSHFNMTTLFDAALYAAMGIAALLLTSLAPAVAFALHRAPSAGLPPILRVGAVLGLALTLPLTLLTAGTLTATGGALIGAGAGEGATLPLLGWSFVAGDLRVSHFFGTHAMQAVPILVAAAMLLLNRTDARVAVLVAVLYCVFVGATYAQALLGQPFLPL